MMKKTGILRHHRAETLEEGKFVDLGSTPEAEEASAGAKATVRMAEVLRYDDIHHATKLAYQGDIVLLDYTSIANDPVTVRRMSLDLKAVARDINGDVAGVAKNLLCLTPNGVKIDRQKLRPSL